MEVNSVVTLNTINDQVIITQNETDFTIATSIDTTTKVAGDTFMYDSLTIMLGSVYGSLSTPVICFKEGTMITCLNADTKEEIEIPVESIPPDTYVKTYKHGFIRLQKLAYHVIENPSHAEISKNRLYIYEPSDKNPDLKEPLVMSGCHSVLTDTITEEQRSLMVEHLGKIYVTDGKYRLLCMYDSNAKPYTVAGTYKIWHVCLDHYDEKMNYGIYANGMLVESCSYLHINYMY
jgi:hypothetical protein